jgi:hypothetical protein
MRWRGEDREPQVIALKLVDGIRMEEWRWFLTQKRVYSREIKLDSKQTKKPCHINDIGIH